MIQDIVQKIKTRQGEIYWLIISILLMLTIVGSWQLWLLHKAKFPVHIQRNAFEMKMGEAPTDAGGEYIASRAGSVYYSPGCKGSSRIKPENRIIFYKEVDAVDAGYAKASSCD